MSSRVAVLLLLGALAACSSSESSDLFDPVGQAVPTDPADEGSSGESARDPDEPSDDAPPSSSAGDAGAPPSGDDDAGAPKAANDADPPAPTCTQETESNDARRDADPFTGCIEGALAGKDVDHARIRAPKNAKSVQLKHAETGAKVEYRVTVGVVTYTLFGGSDSPTLPAVPDATYTFAMRPDGDGNTARTWHLEVLFK